MRERTIEKKREGYKERKGTIRKEREQRERKRTIERESENGREKGE